MALTVGNKLKSDDFLSKHLLHLLKHMQVIFSRSAKNLQIILNKLESLCDNAELSVNLDKTKIMIVVSL